MSPNTAVSSRIGRLGAEAVHARVIEDMSSVSLRTVYSTVHELADMGELVQIQLGTGSARFDPNVIDHHHLVCDRCGSVQDLETRFPGVVLAADNDDGFEVDHIEIVFRGLCRSCADSSVPTNEHGGAHPCLS